MENASNNQENQTPENANERFIERDGERLEVSENFWNKEKNEPDTFAILKSAQDLRKQIGEDLSPKDGIYQINIPEEYKDKLQANPEDPLYVEFCKIAKSKRMSQKEFDTVSQLYYKTLAESVQEFDSDEYIEKELNAAKQKFGDNINNVKARIENFVNNSGITDKDILNELAFLQTSAAGIATLDYLLSLRGEPMPRGENGAVAANLSEDELREMIARPEYQNGTDKALIEKVKKGFEKLYGTY